MSRNKSRRIPRAVTFLSLAAGARALRRGVRAIDLRDRVALIMGGTRGLGLLLGRELATRGAIVAVCGRDQEHMERAEQDLRELSPRSFAAVCNVANRGDVDTLVKRVEGELGPVDILINNAGVMSVGPVEAHTPEDFEHAVGVMYLGMVYPSLAVLPSMKARGFGRIVNITSIGGKVSVPHLLPYSGGKFAAIGFSEGLRAEVARDGIRVTTVVPGLMRTGSYVNAEFKGDFEQEYAWFGLASSSRLLAMDAERAAHRIIEAARYGDAELVLGAQTKVIALLHGLFPGLTTDVLAAINRLLPTGTRTRARRGREIEGANKASTGKAGRRAADELQNR